MPQDFHNILKKFERAPRDVNECVIVSCQSDSRKCLQGTYLPAKIGLDLEQMQQYQSLREMGKQVKNLYEKLRLQHDLLLSQNPELLTHASEEVGTLTRRLSTRLDSISNWKYAPAPLRMLRSRTTGEAFPLALKSFIQLDCPAHGVCKSNDRRYLLSDSG